MNKWVTIAAKALCKASGTAAADAKLISKSQESQIRLLVQADPGVGLVTCGNGTHKHDWVIGQAPGELAKFDPSGEIWAMSGPADTFV